MEESVVGLAALRSRVSDGIADLLVGWAANRQFCFRLVG